MAAFTCISCRVAFADADIQRAHYKTDWHRYNLKRKVAELPPVTAEVFQQKVLAQRSQTAEQQLAEELKDPVSCVVCKKHFHNQNTLENHLKSHKHLTEYERNKKAAPAKGTAAGDEQEQKIVEKENEKNLLLSALADHEASELTLPSAGENAVAESGVMEVQGDSDTESWDGDTLGIEQCLFCSHVSESLELNVKHMTLAHSFFIPDFDYLTDLEGLITYLGAKVGEGHLCLWCNEVGKSFHSTRAVQQHMTDKGHCKMLHEGDALVEYADFYDYRKSYPDFHPSDGAVPAGEETADEVSPEVLETDGYQLTLPSGATVGHRQLARYYRQNLTHTLRASATAMSRIMSQYRSLGWTGTEGVLAQRKAKDIAYLQRIRQKHNMQVGVKGNKLQKYYRAQILM